VGKMQVQRMQGYRSFQTYNSFKILGVRHVKLTYTTEDPKMVEATLQNSVSHLWKNFGAEVVIHKPQCFRALTGNLQRTNVDLKMILICA
jgi:hypothetical protein